MNNFGYAIDGTTNKDKDHTGMCNKCFRDVNDRTKLNNCRAVLSKLNYTQDVVSKFCFYNYASLSKLIKFYTP